MFRQFQRLVTFSAALVICAAIFYLVSLFYNHIGAVATKITATPKPSAGVVYVMTFKNSAPAKPSQGSKPNSSKSQGESPH
jgi:hypothetical protein